MKKNRLRRRFYAYVIPSLLSLTFIGIYTIVDGFFVGNSVGDDGLAAIGLVYPIVALIAAAGTGIGMGGAILKTISKAAGDISRSQRYARCTVTVLILSSIVLSAVILTIDDQIMGYLGAEGRVFDYGKDYLRIIFIGAVVQMLGSGLPPLIRNHNGASYAMAITIAGCACNMILDYVFVIKMGFGVSGAAWATVTGQMIPMICGILFFVMKRIPVFTPVISAEIIYEIIRTGAASFGLTLCPSIALLLMNLFAIKYGGLQAVTCYTVVSYMTWIAYLVLQGIGDGCQPLFSECFGSNNEYDMKRYVRMGYSFALVMAVICTLILFFLREVIGATFGASPEVSEAFSDTLPILLIGFIPIGYARVSAARLYATAQSGKASLLTYAESAFLFILLLVFPQIGGLRMVWWSMTLSQICTAIMALLLMMQRRQYLQLQ